MVVVPTTYGHVHEDVLYEAGANIFIYANHLMRAKIAAVDEYLAAHSVDIRQVLPASLVGTAEARNFGYLLQSLKYIKAEDAQGSYSAGFDAFLAGAEGAAQRKMEETAQRLIDCKQATAADDTIISVKDLLTVNGVHHSDLGRPQKEGETEAVTTNAIVERLMSRLRTRATSTLRNGSRWFA